MAAALAQRPAGRDDAASLHAEAWLLQARLDRRLGAPVLALDLLRIAAGHLPPSLAAPERAALCRELSLAYRDRGWFDEALALLDRAARLFRADERVEQLAEVRAEAGWIAATEGDPQAAFDALSEALALWREQPPEGHAVEIWLGFAAAHAAMGRPLAANLALERARGGLARLATPRQRIPWLWEEARVLGRLGDWSNAAARLRAIRAAVSDRPQALLVVTCEQAAVAAARGHQGHAEAHRLLVALPALARAAGLPPAARREIEAWAAAPGSPAADSLFALARYARYAPFDPFLPVPEAAGA